LTGWIWWFIFLQFILFDFRKTSQGKNFKRYRLCFFKDTCNAFQIVRLHPMFEKTSLHCLYCRSLYAELKAEEDERLAREAAELAASGGDGGTPVKEDDASVSGKKGGKSSAK
jgi:hypothetical protein